MDIAFYRSTRRYIEAHILGLIAIIALVRAGHAQNLQPYDLQAHAAGTNLVQVQFDYGHFTDLEFTDGTKLSQSGYNSYFTTLRYQYSFALAGHPAAVQVFQGFGVFKDVHFFGETVSGPGIDTIGATNTTLSAEFWPYASPDSATQIYTAIYLAPPDGSHSKGNLFNTAYGNWSGSAQLGIFQRFTSNLSAEGAFNATFAGDESLGGGLQRSVDPIYGVQVWGNWDWENGWHTSLGYVGSWGGAQKIKIEEDPFPFGTFNTGRASTFQRIRADVAYWWTPKLGTDVQVSHDIVHPGGYGLGIAVVGRVTVLF